MLAVSHLGYADSTLSLLSQRLLKRKIQRLSIRLLRPGVRPEDAFRKAVDLRRWDALGEAQIATGVLGGNAPGWVDFLELTDDEREGLENRMPYGVVFVVARGRWFAVTFGLAHVKLDPNKFEEGFGLRVVLNSVDPEKIRSTDLRTPDENTMSRRSQTSRDSRQEAFSIDIERDIVQGLAGTPKDLGFALRVAGADALVVDKELDIRMLQSTCDEAYRMWQRSDYKAEFGWIDHVRHVGSQDLISALKTKAVAKLDQALKSDDPGDLGLACPVIYDPQSLKFIRYRGFGSTARYPDLEIQGYLKAMQDRGLATYSSLQFENHSVREVDSHGRDDGRSWKIQQCLVLDIAHDGKHYVLSAGRWYEIDTGLASRVQRFFREMPQFPMPAARVSDNEVTYNDRLRQTHSDFLCLDGRTVRPTDARSPIEVCDFLTRNRELIHVKDRTSSSRLSHLFNQGTVSGRVLIADPQAREAFRREIRQAQAARGLTGFTRAIPTASAKFDPSRFTVVYAVLGKRSTARLPFFSLVTLRQAVRDLRSRGYRCAFAWVPKSSV